MLDQTIREVVERKLALLVGYVDELSPLVAGTTPCDSKGNVARRAIERLVQVIVEVTIDVNGLLATAEGQPQPRTARESFRAAATAGFLPEKTAERFITSYVGLRNRIVHDYDTLDARLVEDAARRLAADGLHYAKQVRAWLSTRGGDPTRDRAS